MGQVQCLALIVCDQVIEDKRTSNKSLIGMFNAIIAPALPLTKSLCVFVAVTGMDELVPMSLKLAGPAGVLTEINWEPNESVKTQAEMVHDLVIQMPDLALPQVGAYHFELWQDKRLLARRGFSVFLKEADQNRPMAKG